MKRSLFTRLYDILIIWKTFFFFSILQTILHNMHQYADIVAIKYGFVLHSLLDAIKEKSLYRKFKESYYCTTYSKLMTFFKLPLKIVRSTAIIFSKMWHSSQINSDFRLINFLLYSSITSNFILGYWKFYNGFYRRVMRSHNTCNKYL